VAGVWGSYHNNRRTGKRLFLTAMYTEIKNMSWIIRNKETKEVIFETFEQSTVDKINTEKYEVVPILEYLVSINGQQPADQVRKPTTELIASGEQYVIPGAEKTPIKKGQGSFW
jgi:hypothetical protein